MKILTASRLSVVAKWDAGKNEMDAPQLMGTKAFTFEELSKCTNNFSDANDVGGGGYGQVCVFPMSSTETTRGSSSNYNTNLMVKQVYKGTLPNGQVIAIKRAQQGSMQGAFEFKTEIELLSRVHHKNVVKLLGFCFDQKEQMLVYEYISNGSLKDSLSGKIKLLSSS